MAIDIGREQIEPLGQAARRLPSSRRGKKIHASTLYRWSKRGLGGIRLETIRIGGATYTSREALQRFFDRLAPPQASGSVVMTQVTEKPKRSQMDVERRLKEIGL